ncbi:MFS transporter [Umezawaea endophytica]|uniref:MFS transporter n=1 Tax=Umezawaea endophytica TaxID=1654476 RepID=A0A9X3ADA4_9PSEU|nr:MFS transporter [Umezawaea endophytica]MCS7475426.1 MFS transporter [Umezawaea endophytica]
MTAPPAPPSDRGFRARAAVPAVLTAAMAFSMLPLFLLGTLAPALITEFAITRPMLGALVTAGFGVAAALSLVIGSVVDAVGARRSAVALFAVSGIALAVFATASHYLVLVAAVALAGVPQALANPSTNKVVATAVAPARRGGVIGVKQSGVQVGAFVAGLPLAWLADGVDWRAAVGTAAGLALLFAVAGLLLPADPEPARVPVSADVPPAGPTVWWLLGFSVLLGSGIAAVNTYVALFATQDLGFGARAAAALVAGLGVTGVVGRIAWSRLVSAARPPGAVLVPLCVAAVLAALALLLAPHGGAGLAWAGVLGVGAFAVAANAVSMLAVVAASTPRRTGRDSALVSAGFFTGFAVGPPLFGLLVEVGGYGTGWALVALEFAAAAVVIAVWRART